MKKKVSLFIILIMLISLVFAACGEKGTEGSSAAGSSENPANAADGEKTGEPTKLVLSLMIPGLEPQDMHMVQDAVNEITREEINVEVEFFPISMSEAQQGKYSLMITGGNQMDLICIPFADPYEYVASGLIEPLNDLLSQHAPTITALAEETPQILSTATFDGEVYGVTPRNASYGNAFGIMVSGNHLDETGFPEKERFEIYTVEEITEIFSKIKELHPELYPMALNTTNTKYKSFFPVDFLGATHSSGVLLDFDSTTIVNLFETQQFLDYCLQMREWYEMGFILPDVDTTDKSFIDELLSGSACSYYEFVEPAQISDQNPFGTWGRSVPLQMTINYNYSMSPSDVVSWVVPISSADSAAAVKLLNLTFENHDLANLLLYGIEGIHWVAAEQEGIIQYPEGLDSNSVGYTTGYGIWGDRRYEKKLGGSITQEVNDIYTAKNMETQFKSVGYAFNVAQHTNEIITIGAVLDTYLPSLGYGVVPNVEETIAKMNKELKTAGIAGLIEANQTQFDAWLAEQE